MRQLICIFFVVILVYMTSKLKINIQSLTKQENSLKIKFRVNVGIYLLGVIKVFGISFKEDGIHFLFFKISYREMKIDQKMVKEISVWKLLKSLHPKFEQFAFHLKIGSEDVMLTVFSVFAISTFLSMVSAQNRKQINQKNYCYEIMPIYGKNALSFQASSQISMYFERFFLRKNLRKTKGKRI